MIDLSEQNYKEKTNTYKYLLITEKFKLLTSIRIQNYAAEMCTLKIEASPILVRRSETRRRLPPRRLGAGSDAVRCSVFAMG